MPSSPPAELTTPFVCDCEGWMRSACNGLSFFEQHEGKRYCVLHYPGVDKVSAFSEVLKKKLHNQDFDFRGVWFPGDVSFSGVSFTTPADFTSAAFNAKAFFHSAKFSEEVNFYSATFGGESSFDSATFSVEVNFQSATFGGEADFSSVTFKGESSFESATFSAQAYFQSSTFGETVNFTYAVFAKRVNFTHATFNAVADFTLATFGEKADFRFVTFKDYVRFAQEEEVKVFGDNTSMSLQFARIEKPDRLSFHTVTLRPHWFVNVDARKFEFINADWNWRRLSAKEELESIDVQDARSVPALLSIACRNLAVNAEDNHRYEEASRFRYMAMDAQRLESRQSWRGTASWILGWLYWGASGYGERMGRAFLVLMGISVLFAAFYVGLGFPNWGPRAAEKAGVEAQRIEQGGWSQMPKALLYSLGVITLQKPEPRPATDAAQALVMLETILGPVQAALLALAIRRKFMR